MPCCFSLCFLVVVLERRERALFFFFFVFIFSEVVFFVLLMNRFFFIKVRWKNGMNRQEWGWSLHAVLFDLKSFTAARIASSASMLQ